MQKVLVTGATGFIASHIIIQLLNQEFQVIVTVCNEKSSSVRGLVDEISKQTHNNQAPNKLDTKFFSFNPNFFIDQSSS